MDSSRKSGRIEDEADPLVADLKAIRLRGLIRNRIRELPLPQLRSLRFVRDRDRAYEDSPDRAIEELVVSAIERLGDGAEGAVAKLIFGIDARGRGRILKARRSLAAPYVNRSSADSLRHVESDLLAQVADHVRDLEFEHARSGGLAGVADSALQVTGSGLLGKLAAAGIRRFHFARTDYEENLLTYLSLAERSIDIVSISLTMKNWENDLIPLFADRLRRRASFRLRVSLLSPVAPILESAARTLNTEPKGLRDEIRIMLRALLELQERLPARARGRCLARVHDVLPMGSAILLDATPDSGRIQVETKLYRAPRVESFGFEVVGPSSFYQRQFRSWTMLLKDSRAPGTRDVGRRP